MNTQHDPKTDSGLANSAGKSALFVIVFLIVTVVVIVAVTLPFNYEVIAKGQLLDYTQGRIYELRLYDRFNVYIEPEIKPNKDFLNGAMLGAVSFIAMTFSICLHAFGVRGYAVARQFFAVLSVGFLYLAADELLGIHESMGHNLQYLSAVPGIERPDDLIIVMYGLVALLFLIVYRKFLWRYRRAGRWFAATLVLFGFAAAADAFSSRYEEYLELLGSVCLVIGTMDLGLLTLRDQVQRH